MGNRGFIYRRDKKDWIKKITELLEQGELKQGECKQGTLYGMTYIT